MKSLPPSFTFILAALLSSAVSAADNTIFACTLEDGKIVSMERDISDTFTFAYGNDLKRPETLIQKNGNDLGTSYHHSQAEGASNREVYVTAKDLMFTIGANDQNGVRTGYLQINQASVQKYNSDCINGTMLNKFDDFDLFINLTEVD
jgi:hypothetical protein